MSPSVAMPHQDNHANAKTKSMLNIFIQVFSSSPAPYAYFGTYTSSKNLAPLILNSWSG